MNANQQLFYDKVMKAVNSNNFEVKVTHYAQERGSRVEGIFRDENNDKISIVVEETDLIFYTRYSCKAVERNGVIIVLTTHKLAADRITSLDQLEDLINTYRQVISNELSPESVLEAKIRFHPYLKVINQVKSLGYQVSDVTPSGTVALTKNKYKVKIQLGQKKLKLGFDVESQDKMAQVPINKLKNLTYFIEQCELRNKNQRYCPELVLRDLNLQGWGE